MQVGWVQSPSGKWAYIAPSDKPSGDPSLSDLPQQTWNPRELTPENKKLQQTNQQQYIPNTEIARLWSHGFTKTKSLKGITNPGLYLTAYLGDMEVTEALQAGTLRDGKLAETADKSKAVIKGARLKLYPPGFNLYRCSREIKHPGIWQVSEEQAQAEVSGIELTYEKTVAITDEGGTLRNIINYRTYSSLPAKEKSTNSEMEEN